LGGGRVVGSYWPIWAVVRIEKLAITGVMRSAPTAAVGVLLGGPSCECDD